MEKQESDPTIHVYVVGDESLADLIPATAGGQKVIVARCDGSETLWQRIAEHMPDVVVMDEKYTAGGKEGLLGNVVFGTHDMPVPVIVLADEPDVDTVVECMNAGAADFLTKSKARDELPARLATQARNHKLLVQVKLLEEVYERSEKLYAMVGVSPALHDIFAKIKNVARSDASVFLHGESGTGKELAAKAIYQISSRSKGEFVAVNCTAIPKDLLESELFGHEKGAFTGADRQRIGSCERADGGVLFLDEICEMDLGLQSKLLRFLQDHTFVRVGGTVTIKVDTRVIAATNRDPLQQVEIGRLREDLYYRLNVVPIHIPPLRERPEDIPVLARHFLETLSDDYGRYFYSFHPEVVRIMLAHSWPGNVRELRNVIERVVVLANTDKVTPDLLPDNLREAAAKREVSTLALDKAMECIQRALKTPAAAAPQDTDEVIPLAELEKKAILAALEKCDGDISKAARKLGLSRATIYRKLEKYKDQ